MAIQTQINRINNAVNTQTDLIAQIQTALQGKAAGGGSGSGGSSGAALETCTVTLVGYASAVDGCGYTSVVDGIVNPVLVTAPPSGQMTLNNVLCGSLISVHDDSVTMVGAATISGEGSFLGWSWPNFYFSAPSTAGAETTFTMYDDD